MQELNVHYRQLLQIGFVILRQAVASGDADWVNAEIEMLHNVPSLIDEANIERHRYFWNAERPHYIAWVSAPGRDAPKSRMMTFYRPIWESMAPIMATLLKEPVARAS